MKGGVLWSEAFVAGGVAANIAIRSTLSGIADSQNMRFVAPPHKLCTDNAAMIAWAGIERYKINLVNNLEFTSRARWPLDSSAPFLKGPGLKFSK